MTFCDGEVFMDVLDALVDSDEGTSDDFILWDDAVQKVTQTTMRV